MITSIPERFKLGPYREVPFESLIVSHHSRFNVTSECNKEEINDDDDVPTEPSTISPKSDEEESGARNERARFRQCKSLNTRVSNVPLIWSFSKMTTHPLLE